MADSNQFQSSSAGLGRGTVFSMRGLKDRIAHVTGGSRGIGAPIAIALAKAGADVAVNYRERAAAANAVCSEITRTTRKVLAAAAHARRLAMAANGDCSPSLGSDT